MIKHLLHHDHNRYTGTILLLLGTQTQCLYNILYAIIVSYFESCSMHDEFTDC